MLEALAAFLIGPDPMPSPWRDPGFNKIVWIQGPHCDRRDPGSVVDTIVLHATVNPSAESTTKWFMNPESKVSSHYTVGKDGSIIEHVSTFDRAWHAGVSKDVEGRTGVNMFSVGIEIVNLNDGKDPFTEAQYQVIDNMVGMLLRRFPTIKYITSHEYIAQPKGRKSDPKGFDWGRLKRWEPRVKLVP
jgi:N-acetylmuramoyl-L-alanine amidase